MDAQNYEADPKCEVIPATNANALREQGVGGISKSSSERPLSQSSGRAVKGLVPSERFSGDRIARPIQPGSRLHRGKATVVFLAQRGWIPAALAESLISEFGWRGM